jgi:hypothetical protein
MAPPSRIIYPDDGQSQFNDIFRRLRALETAPSLASSAIQEGATEILDNTGATRVLLGKDTSDGTYGVKIYDANGRPLITNDGGTVVDGSGVTRVKWGKLDSVPNYGVQVFDSSGGVILDTIGLQQAIKEIATHDISPQNQTFAFTPTNGQDSAHALNVAGTMSGTFSLSRPASILLLGYMTGRASVGSTYGQAQLVVKASGTVVSGPYYAGLWDSRNGGYSSFTSWASIVPLGAGSFTTNWQVYGDNGLTLDVASGHISVFKLGG